MTGPYRTVDGKRFIERGGKIYIEHDENGDVVFYEDKHHDNRYAQLGLREPVKFKWEWPYSYDPIIVYFGNFQKGDHAVCDDRLWQWDYTKCEKYINAVRGKNEQNRFDNNNPVQVGEFLSLYFGKQVTVTAIVDGCNVSNGYPYRIFYYREV